MTALWWTDSDTMNWNRSNVIGLAAPLCTQCGGHGMVNLLRKDMRPCSCVFRAVFRACYQRFRDCVEFPTYAGYRMKREEFIADFELVARRVLSESDHKLFRFTFLLGADWVACCRHLKLDRGNYFHHVYRIQAILGRAYADLKPYALYPVDEYFGGTVRTSRPTPAHEGQWRTRKPEPEDLDEPIFIED